MDSQERPTEPQSEAPPATNPVDVPEDVVHPPPEAELPADQPPAPVPPLAEEDEKEPEPTAGGHEHEDTQPTEYPQSIPQLPPKKRNSGAGLAIVATVIIVLGLAGIAVYAYLKSR